MRNIGVVLFDGVEELDWVGPWEVLSTWSMYWPDDGVTVATVADSTAPLRCAKGARVIPDRSWDDDPNFDVLVIPGGVGSRERLGNGDALHARLRSHFEAQALLVSVCTGSLILAAAGLLRNRPATTHRAALGELQQLDPTIAIQADSRYVDDGEIITAAGVSAGIDVSLHLVRRLHSVERAQAIRRGIQYDPAPPV
ncbi:MAG: DJ-1/PfpI family protein [Gordonia sp. (in: high G+C Gram-positive bacteria)]